MKPLVCEMCGSQDVVKQSGLFICQHCGTKYSVEDARKMMIEGTVKIDTSDELHNLYEVARRAKEAKNNESAAKYYDMILIKDPSSWEANFYAIYFKSMSCKIAEITTAATNVNNCIHSTFLLIHNNVPDDEERKSAVAEVVKNTYAISDMLYKAANSHFDSISPAIKVNYRGEYLSNTIASAGIKKAVCDGLCEIFADDAWIMSTIGIQVLKDRIASGIAITQDSLYVRVITKYDPTYQAPQNQTAEDVMKSITATTADSSGGCYIATAVYGSYDCPQVWTLRRFRDNALATTWYGRLFIHAYYATSPTVVKLFGRTNWFQRFCKERLDSFVCNLRKSGVESTPYHDKKW